MVRRARDAIDGREPKKRGAKKIAPYVMSVTDGQSEHAAH
jgi:hypothetical protein